MRLTFAISQTVKVKGESEGTFPDGPVVGL